MWLGSTRHRILLRWKARAVDGCSDFSKRHLAMVHWRRVERKCGWQSWRVRYERLCCSAEEMRKASIWCVGKMRLKCFCLWKVVCAQQMMSERPEVVQLLWLRPAFLSWNSRCIRLQVAKQAVVKAKNVCLARSWHKLLAHQKSNRVADQALVIWGTLSMFPCLVFHLFGASCLTLIFGW